MNKIKTFFLNDQKYYGNGEFTILELLQYLDYDITLLVLEYNSLICNKKNWNKIFINDSDTIEIVTIVGGG